ncbi:MAG: ADP-ribosylglycohydrolase family protein, partial [Lentisphaerae bacterium]|nr:ADP-ribosylglycohydrolase family protein [Lentisphaerota bacterium]
APANVAFVVIGLLYGEGDFAKTVCTAVNCGDDTDCTAATAGALLGIILGAKRIPADWKEPIGDSISVISIDFHGAPLKLPKTLSELTGRVLRLRDIAEARDRRSVTPDENFMSREYAEYLWNRSSYELRFNVLFTEIGVEYLDKPYLTPGKPCRVKVSVTDSITASGVVKCRWRLPENWHCDNTGFAIGTRNYCVGGLICTITPPEDFSDAMAYLELEVCTNDHAFPTIVTVPFRRTGGTFIAPRFSPALQSDGTRKYAAVANWIKEFNK